MTAPPPPTRAFTSHCSVALGSNNAQALRPQSLLEAGSLRRGPPATSPAGQDTAAWAAFSTGRGVRGKDDGVCK
jgi:hypothetical protein